MKSIKLAIYFNEGHCAVERVVLKGSQNMFIVCAYFFLFPRKVCFQLRARCRLENNMSRWEVEMNITSSLAEEEQKNQMKRQISTAPHISTKGMLFREFNYIRTN